MRVVEVNAMEYYVEGDEYPTYVVGRRAVDAAFCPFVRPIAMFYELEEAKAYVNKLHYQKGVMVFKKSPEE